MPAAGTLGVAGFTTKLSLRPEHLRPPIIGVLAALPTAKNLQG